MSEVGLFKKATTDAAKVKFDLNPRPVKPDGSSFSKHTPAPDKKFLVIDPETNDVVGEIPVPTDFCPGQSCPYNAHEKNPYSYYNMFPSGTVQRRWVHVFCDRPTRSGWDVKFKDLVTVLTDKLPWQHDS